MKQKTNSPVKNSEIARLKSKHMWNISEGERIMQMWKESAVSLNVYSKQTGIGYKRLVYWKRKVQQETPPSFVEVQVKSSTTEEAGSDEMEVVMNHARRIKIRLGFDSEALKRLIVLMETLS